MKDMKWLWGKVGKDKKRYVFAMILAILVSFAAVVVPHITRIIVDEYISGPNSTQNLVNNREGLIFLIVFAIAFTLFRTSVAYISMMMMEKTSQNLVKTIRNETYELIQKQDKSYYGRHRTGDLMTRLTGDVDMIRHSFAWVLKTIVESLAVFAVAISYLVTINFSLAIWIISLSPLIFLVAFFMSKEVRPKHHALRQRFAELNTMAQENIAANKVVKSFSREDYEIDKFNKKSNEYRNANEKVTFTRVKYTPVLDFISESFGVILLFVGGVYIIKGQITFGEFAAFSSLLWAIANPMRHVGIIMNDLQRFNVSVTKIREIYYAKSKIIKTEYIDNPSRFKGHIVFEDVSFKYGKHSVLENINFEIMPQETIAIMGAVGSGKTTLINLIARLYDVSGGRVLIDGRDVRDYPLDELRANVAIATQSVMLFSDSIYNNIGYGMKIPDESVILKASKEAIAHDFILNTQEGYETLIGEEGVGLSGGQRQRLALARAFASDRPILILDDTTSAVDNETEIEITRTLRKNKEKMTQIIITQRITTAMYADRIMVLEDGKILESGTHDQLLNHEGYYKEMAKLQETGGEV